MIANWLVSMKTTLFFFLRAEELNYQETSKRKGGGHVNKDVSHEHLWIQLPCTPTVQLSQTAAARQQ